MRELLRPLGGEEVRVENEERDDVAASHRGREWPVVGDAELLAPEPDERTHGHECAAPARFDSFRMASFTNPRTGQKSYHLTPSADRVDRRQLPARA
jgi:hypothetical protein